MSRKAIEIWRLMSGGKVVSEHRLSFDIIDNGIDYTVDGTAEAVLDDAGEPVYWLLGPDVEGREA